MSEHLDPLRLPLHGSRLIEASAGTGKTWTIAALYLRLILGHGDDDTAFARPLIPPEILVMTFTRAATRELSDRIRARLLEAARCFRGETGPEEGDTLLAPLMAAYPPGPSRAGAAWRLATAAEAMDEAAVQTIDAWCQRMLREHAFDSGSLFDEELVADERGLVNEAALDYWRQQMYPLRDEMLELILGIWSSADTLAKDVEALLGRGELDEDEVPSLQELVERFTVQRHELLAPLKANWRSRAGELSAWLDNALADKACPFNKAMVQTRHYGPWLAALTDWAHGSSLDGPALTDKARRRLRPEGMREAFKGGMSTELPDHFDHFEDLMARLEALPDLRAGVRLHAATCVARRVIALKERSGTFGFVDLQERLATALEGPNAERLRKRIVEQYPVALVDEFQDTSPRQYRIFECLYRPEVADRGTALFLIGDPKQSIYGFRGADIFSYLRARRATEGRHYVLGVNHRSTEPLVAAVNRVFGHAESRPGPGAFLFREAGFDQLPFEAVAARGRAERFVRGAVPHEAGGAAAGTAVPALTFCYDEQLSDSRSSQKLLAALCAQEIVTLLNDDATGFEARVPGATTFKRLRPADIAILVRSRWEATAVRRELRRRGVASVYLSDKDSVFDSAEARHMVLWLRAVADPADARFARAAFATPLIGLSVEELRALAIDELVWERRLEELRVLKGVWQRSGVLTMLRQLLHRWELPARWLATPDGERRLTNVLHLAELLQAASPGHEGEQALIGWFIAQVGGAGEKTEERILRLESDADLVKVITVHKSKGLEFPVVFLPFATAFKRVSRKQGFLEVVDTEGRRLLDFGMTKDTLERADRERLREDLRLLYVALTRARHAVWIGVAALTEGTGKACTLSDSALGRLLTGGAAAESGRLLDLLVAARGDCEHIALVSTAKKPAFTGYRSRVVLEPLLAAPVYAGAFERDWGIGSFSTLVRDAVSRGAVTPALRNDEPECRMEGGSLGGLANAPWHRFPRGALPGNFLHEQLKWLAEERFDLGSDSHQQRLRRRCEQQGWGHRQDEVVEWLSALSLTKLPPLGISLQGLDAALPEMEFWLPAGRLAAVDVDAICRRHVLPGQERPALPPQQLHGMLMGFADLVFEHADRYWVLDYKSNALGPGDAAYSPGALEGAIAAHRYDVQGALYLLALHRLVRARLGARYRPERHLGGAIFFFIRGIRADNAGCYGFQASATMLDDLDRLLTAPKAMPQ